LGCWPTRPATSRRRSPRCAPVGRGGSRSCSGCPLPSRMSCGQRRGWSASNLRAACRSNVAGRVASRHEGRAHAAPGLFAAFATGSGRRRARRSRGHSVACGGWRALPPVLGARGCHSGDPLAATPRPPQWLHPPRGALTGVRHEVHIVGGMGISSGWKKSTPTACRGVSAEWCCWSHCGSATVLQYVGVV